MNLVLSENVCAQWRNSGNFEHFVISLKNCKSINQQILNDSQDMFFATFLKCKIHYKNTAVFVPLHIKTKVHNTETRESLPAINLQLNVKGEINNFIIIDTPKSFW